MPKEKEKKKSELMPENEKAFFSYTTISATAAATSSESEGMELNRLPIDAAATFCALMPIQSKSSCI